MTLCRKLIRDHSGRTLSTRMRAPALGALGRMSEAGVSASSRRQVSTVAPTMPTTNSALASSACSGSNVTRNLGSAYMVEKIVERISGSTT